ncbi:MAG: preprotein translocase subunit SecG [Verrucomicrobia bacterium]|nr:MAG: preprotein translocase subunit SecG [Verrucomicrobiota bacterium]
MILAATDWLTISIHLLTVLFVVICLLMILVVLMQRPKQEGLGAAFGGGVTDQVFGARTTNVLQRGTVYLGSGFFLIALLLAILIGIRNDHDTLVKKAPAKEAKVETAPAPVVEAPAPTPEVPKSLEAELPPTAPAPVEIVPPAPEPVVPTETAPAPAPAPESTPLAPQNQ